MFRAQFVEIARKRCSHIASLVDRDLRGAASELHCLSGEASMLDFGKVSDLATVAEDAARSGDAARLRTLLTELGTAIHAVEQRSDGS